MEAFDILRVLGKGNFGKVLLVKKKDSQRVYAIKALRKQHILDRGGECVSCLCLLHAILRLLHSIAHVCFDLLWWLFGC